ncbi:diacylglycerol kinase (ATP) [Methylomagnum ishizawai]|uniref:Diacylglycerol kinase n=1 Tax=Methylomagnum ishizawai TaxID=1760988 RepID=A0A1Y6D3X4_9GAMM|nr:diacylglycerol kinase [Methylomagnum ishizawai]SMF97301.1 diacylglycerol kinase (ATP) [Methylomagnum ishizawai]
MAGQSFSGIRRIYAAFFNSLAGFRAAWDHEEAFRQECLLCLVGVPLGLWLGQTGIERALLAGVLLNVLVVELLNSALEATVDRIGYERHTLSGRAKDIGSAAVFLALALAALVWLLVLMR